MATSPQPPAELYTLQYMNRFRCIAEKCEDTCCAGLVPINQPELDRIQAALGPDGVSDLLAGLEQGRELPDGTVGLLRSRGQVEDRRCHFLEPDNLCRIAKRSAEAIPDDCHEYPRIYGIRPGGRMEVVARLGCPEAARLALLAEDGLEYVPAKPDVSHHYPVVPKDFKLPAFAEPLFDVRAWGVRRLRDRNMPLGSRLLAIAELGRRVDGSFNAGAAQVDRPALDQAMAEVEAPESLAAIKATGAFEVSVPLVNMISTTLLTRRNDTRPRYADLYTRVMAGYYPPVSGGVPAARNEEFWAAVGKVFAERRSGPHTAALDVVLERYCVNDWYRHSYHRARSLSEAAFQLAIRAAFVRFLALGHPAVGGSSERQITPEAAAVEAVQVFTRDLEAWSVLPAAVDRFFSEAALRTDSSGRIRAAARFLS